MGQFTNEARNSWPADDPKKLENKEQKEDTGVAETKSRPATLVIPSEEKKEEKKEANPKKNKPK